MHYFAHIPKSPNRRLNPNNHYRDANANYRIRDEAKAFVAKYFQDAPQFPDAGPVHINWHVFWPKGGRSWDPDNLIAGLKYHQDTLARAIGINDSRITSEVHQYRDPKGEGFMLCLVSG